MDLHEITKDLEKLDALYTEQIRSFDAQTLPDLETHTKERQEAFDQLKTHMAALLPAMGDKDIERNQGVMEEMMGHLKLLAKQNSTLKTRVEAVKEELKTSMARLKTGKKVINAYRAPQSIRNRPKVLTIRNY
jgi:seryl-tRNA synthetase